MRILPGTPGGWVEGTRGAGVGGGHGLWVVACGVPKSAPAPPTRQLPPLLAFCPGGELLGRTPDSRAEGKPGGFLPAGWAGKEMKRVLSELPGGAPIQSRWRTCPARWGEAERQEGARIV